MYLFFWLHQVFLATCGVSHLHGGMLGLLVVAHELLVEICGI